MNTVAAKGNKEVRVTAILRMPSEIKNALIEAAGVHSLNDYAVSVLAQKYGIPYTLAARRSPGTADAPHGEAQVILRMPYPLHEALSYEAFSTRQSLNTLAVRELAAQVRYTYDPPARGAPRGRRR